MIDWSQVAQLRQDVGVEDFGEVLDIFFEEVEEVTAQIAQAIPPGDLGKHLHFLKGSASNLGFTEFSEACQKGETLCDKGAENQVNIPEILTVYSGSKQAFFSGISSAFPE